MAYLNAFEKGFKERWQQEASHHTEPELLSFISSAYNPLWQILCIDELDKRGVPVNPEVRGQIVAEAMAILLKVVEE